MTALPRLVSLFDRFRRDDDGQGLAEYALILALIAIVAIVALIFLGSQVSDKLSVIGSQLELGRAVTGRHDPPSSTTDRARRVHRIRRALPDSDTLQQTLRHAWNPAVSS